MRRTHLTLLLVLFAAIGCEDAGDAGPPPPPPGPTSTRERLAGGQELALAAEGSVVEFDTFIDYPGGGLTHATVAIRGGHLRLRAADGGALVVEAAALDVEDMLVKGGPLPPEGLRLTGVSASVSGEVTVAARWSEDGAEATAEATIDLLVDWALALGAADPIPLAQVRLHDLPLALRVGADAAGHLTAALDASGSGVFWQWASLVQVSDLRLTSRWLDDDAAEGATP